MTNNLYLNRRARRLCTCLLFAGVGAMNSCGNVDKGHASTTTPVAKVDRVHFRSEKFFLRHVGDSAPAPVYAGGTASPGSMTSDHPDIVAIGADGHLVAKTRGTATISSGDEKLRVSVLDIRGFRLVPVRVEIAQGQHQPLQAFDSEGRAIDSEAFEWFTDSPAITQVIGGDLVGGQRPGFAHIRAVLDTMSVTIEVFVEPKKKAEIAFVSAPHQVRVGGIATYTLPPHSPEVSWSSSNSRVLAMKSAGTFHAQRLGVATVCAMASEKQHTCVEVEVTK